MTRLELKQILADDEEGKSTPLATPSATPYPCFWSVLFSHSLSFEYISNSLLGHLGPEKTDDVLHSSLFDYIHPEEVDRARVDLADMFMVKRMTGSLITCRLRRFEFQKVGFPQIFRRASESNIKRRNSLLESIQERKFSLPTVPNGPYLGATGPKRLAPDHDSPFRKRLRPIAEETRGGSNQNSLLGYSIPDGLAASTESSNDNDSSELEEYVVAHIALYLVSKSLVIALFHIDQTSIDCQCHAGTVTSPELVALSLLMSQIQALDKHSLPFNFMKPSEKHAEIKLPPKTIADILNTRHVQIYSMATERLLCAFPDRAFQCIYLSHAAYAINTRGTLKSIAGKRGLHIREKDLAQLLPQHRGNNIMPRIKVFTHVDSRETFDLDIETLLFRWGDLLFITQQARQGRSGGKGPQTKYQANSVSGEHLPPHSSSSTKVLEPPPRSLHVSTEPSTIPVTALNASSGITRKPPDNFANQPSETIARSTTSVDQSLPQPSIQYGADTINSQLPQKDECSVPNSKPTSHFPDGSPRSTPSLQHPSNTTQVPLHPLIRPFQGPENLPRRQSSYTASAPRFSEDRRFSCPVRTTHPLDNTHAPNSTNYQPIQSLRPIGATATSSVVDPKFSFRAFVPSTAASSLPTPQGNSSENSLSSSLESSFSHPIEHAPRDYFSSMPQALPATTATTTTTPGPAAAAVALPSPAPRDVIAEAKLDHVFIDPFKAGSEDMKIGNRAKQKRGSSQIRQQPPTSNFSSPLGNGSSNPRLMSYQLPHSSQTPQIIHSSMPHAQFHGPHTHQYPPYHNSHIVMNMIHQQGHGVRSNPFPFATTSPQVVENERKVCMSCGTDNSPEWRRGPNGHKT
ncbi:hypothetical protein H4219_002768 [Mycoemilia scoparia]|uniref:GATA-type domain-containing protein n=1 Tax=Mycoemilia scoparia TaxID=417184 RepID=A0A9W8A382_9FUNG|nr:hypothetical protein H4219_002768 [Mycoemilia scoparia]